MIMRDNCNASRSTRKAKLFKILLNILVYFSLHLKSGDLNILLFCIYNTFLKLISSNKKITDCFKTSLLRITSKTIN